LGIHQQHLTPVPVQKIKKWKKKKKIGEKNKKGRKKKCLSNISKRKNSQSSCFPLFSHLNFCLGTMNLDIC